MPTNPEVRPLDRRQRKTRLAIQTALLALMKEKRLEKITVSELAARADVNRKTFYNHYANVLEVRRELDQHFIDCFLQILSDAPSAAIRSNPAYFIEQLVLAMSVDPDRTRLIFDSGEHIYLAQRFKELALPNLAEVALTHCEHPEYLPYVADYLANGLIALMERWVRTATPALPSDFAHMATELIRSSAYVLGFYDE